MNCNFLTLLYNDTNVNTFLVNLYFRVREYLNIPGGIFDGRAAI